MVVGPPTGGMEASPAAAMAPSSAGRPSPFGSRVIATPEQLQRVLVRCSASAGGRTGRLPRCSPRGAVMLVLPNQPAA